ncbi:CBS domain-containing protein [Oceanobacillus sojae]|uniref:CBS domain-containing protein n=1 Tax=Oceanobacillus sojae TaxID=582851 RepID=UPI0009883C6B|nr:CBS domain-containing protein [Oceanobacillus sojae]
MAIPIVTFLFFILSSLTYYALKETMLSAPINEEVRSKSVLRFLPFAVIFLGLFSSAWLTVAVSLPIARYFSNSVSIFSQAINEFIIVFGFSMLLFGIWISLGFSLPKWLTKNNPQLVRKGLSLIFRNSIGKAAINLQTPSNKNQGEAQNIIEFSGKDVGEIATHRTDLTVLQIDATLEEVFSVVQEVEFTRIPVYEEDIDQIAGILYVKDFFHVLKTGVAPAFFSLKNMIRPAMYVRMNQEIDDIFKDMRERDYTIAIVLDEFGGTHGLITLEDIIRDITKDLLEDQKPMSAESKDILPLTGNRYLINGSTSLFILEGTLGIEFPIDTPHQTLDSFLSDLITKQSDNQNRVQFKHLLFNIQSVKDGKIESVIVTVHDEDTVEHQFIG